MKRNRRANSVPGFPGVTRYLDRHHKPRYRLRKMVGGKKIDHTFKATFGTPSFSDEYQTAFSGIMRTPVAADRTMPGTIDALVLHYYKTPAFLALKEASQRDYKCVLEKFRTSFGHEKVAALKARHVEMILAQYSKTPAQANKLLKRLRTLMRLSIRLEMRETDPTLGIQAYKQTSEGYHSWTDAEILTFEETHPAGTMARLAFALMLYLGQRRSDVVKMGPQHVKNMVVSITQQKTGTKLALPIHTDLQGILDRTKIGHMNFLVNAYGRPFSAAGFGNRMRKWCDEAGLHSCSSHGLRKAAARRLAEAGCTSKQIGAVTGHKSLKELELYVAAADQQILAGQAIALFPAAKKDKKG